jgi:secreted trypsin-like serine protease
MLAGQNRSRSEPDGLAVSPDGLTFRNIPKRNFVSRSDIVSGDHAVLIQSRARSDLFARDRNVVTRIQPNHQCLPTSHVLFLQVRPARLH